MWYLLTYLLTENREYWNLLNILRKLVLRFKNWRKKSSLAAVIGLSNNDVALAGNAALNRQCCSQLKTAMLVRSYYAWAQPSQAWIIRLAWSINNVTEVNWTDRTHNVAYWGGRLITRNTQPTAANKQMNKTPLLLWAPVSTGYRNEWKIPG